MSSAPRDYAGVAVTVPVTVPYQKQSERGAAWFIGTAFRTLLAQAGLAKADVDGLAVASFTLAPDTVVAMTEYLGVSPRWIEHLPTGGASGVMALRRAARAVQCGDADIVACIGGDTANAASFAELVKNFSAFSDSSVFPYGGGGPNLPFALMTRHYMDRYGAERADFGRICVAQRYNAAHYETALFRDKPLSLEDYLAARPVAEPLHLYDCVMPCAGADAFLVMSEAAAERLDLAYARVRSADERHNAWFEDPIQFRGGWDTYRDGLYERAGLAPADIDVIECYDDYPVVVMMQLEDLGFCAKGDGPARVRERTLTLDGDLPLNTSGGQLSAGQPGAAGGFLTVVEALRQLAGTAGDRQVAAAHRALVSGYGMVNYDRCLCTAAAILEQGA